MGDGNRIRASNAWSAFGKIYVRNAAAWPEINRAWVRDSNAWKLWFSKEEPPSILCATARICQDSGTGAGCNTLVDCIDPGEQHRVGWTYSGAASGYHAEIFCSVSGGGYTLHGDSVPLNQADPDAGCCTGGGGCGTVEGEWMTQYGVNSASACTTTYDYRVKAAVDGTHVAVGSSADASQQTGCDSACLT